MTPTSHSHQRGWENCPTNQLNNLITIRMHTKLLPMTPYAEDRSGGAASQAISKCGEDILRCNYIRSTYHVHTTYGGIKIRTTYADISIYIYIHMHT
jgi:hypothetical protein